MLTLEEHSMGRAMLTFVIAQFKLIVLVCLVAATIVLAETTPGSAKRLVVQFWNRLYRTRIASSWLFQIPDKKIHSAVTASASDGPASQQFN
jgi:hypothetical protein